MRLEESVAAGAFLACVRSLQGRNCARGIWVLPAKKILIVEDGYLLAEAIADSVRSCGMEPVGPVGRLEQACRMARERALDGALLDVRLNGDVSFPVASILRMRGIPFIFLTGYENQQIPLDFRGAPVLPKPFEIDELKEAIASLPSARWRQDSPPSKAQPMDIDSDADRPDPDQPLGAPPRKQ
jgi:DNA-binding response OmpR family regulator